MKWKAASLYLVSEFWSEGRKKKKEKKKKIGFGKEKKRKGRRGGKGRGKIYMSFSTVDWNRSFLAGDAYMHV